MSDDIRQKTTDETGDNGMLLSARHLFKSFEPPAGFVRAWTKNPFWGAAPIQQEPDPAAGDAAGSGITADTDPSTHTTFAVNDVSLDVPQGETVAIIGESGSGKTTLARLLLRLVEPDAKRGGTRDITRDVKHHGEHARSHSAPQIIFEGHDLLAARGAKLRALRREMQMIFQDPFSSLDPRMRVFQIVGEPLEIHEPRLSGAERQARVAEALAAVGLDDVGHAAFSARIFRRPAPAHWHRARLGAASEACGGG